jgi:hypothetical protein
VQEFVPHEIFRYSASWGNLVSLAEQIQLKPHVTLALDFVEFCRLASLAQYQFLQGDKGKPFSVEESG